uniref:Uncharacterized protein n=1 Tax=Labrus bergylta TaxID=56723 RepID=A0A3Q3DZN4_9LABR
MAVNKCVKYLLFIFNLLFWVSLRFEPSFVHVYVIHRDYTCILNIFLFLVCV